MRTGLTIFLLACLAASCGDRTHAPSPERAPSRHVTIGYSRLRISLPIFVAEQEGIFVRHGIDARLVMYDTAQPMMQALLEGNMSAAGYTALPISYAGMARSGSSLLFVTAMVEDQAHRISYLLQRRARSDAEPSIRGIAGLRGRTIGILPTIAYRVWLEAILAREGILPREVTIQPIEPLLQTAALANGGVDALFTNDPAATAALEAGVAVPITDFVETPRALGEPFLFGSFNVRRDWADAHPAEVARLTAALDEAIALIDREPRRAKRAMVPYLPEAFRSHVDRYPSSRYLPSFRVGEEDFERVARDYLRLGILEQPLDLRGSVRITTASAQ